MCEIFTNQLGRHGANNPGHSGIIKRGARWEQQQRFGQAAQGARSRSLHHLKAERDRLDQATPTQPAFTVRLCETQPRS